MDIQIKGDNDDGDNNNVWSMEPCPASELKVLSLSIKKIDMQSQPRMQKEVA